MWKHNVGAGSNTYAVGKGLVVGVQRSELRAESNVLELRATSDSKLTVKSS